MVDPNTKATRFLNSNSRCSNQCLNFKLLIKLLPQISINTPLLQTNNLHLSHLSKHHSKIYLQVFNIKIITLQHKAGTIISIFSISIFNNLVQEVSRMKDFKEVSLILQLLIINNMGKIMEGVALKLIPGTNLGTVHL